MELIKQNREFMKSIFVEEDTIQSDQEKGIPVPPLQKPYEGDSIVVDLPKPDESVISKSDIYRCLKDRRSERKYRAEALSLKELALLLWATQGIDKVSPKRYYTERPVPSAGGRHPFETYLVINNIEGVEPGLYRYLPLTHQLLFMYKLDNSVDVLDKATLGQRFVGESAVVFIWSCVPYRSEWRYNIYAHKVMLLDIGHVCQNLYLACEALGCSTCAIAAYSQQLVDGLIKVDGVEEFSVYLAPVGKKA